MSTPMAAQGSLGKFAADAQEHGGGGEFQRFGDWFDTCCLLHNILRSLNDTWEVEYEDRHEVWAEVGGAGVHDEQGVAKWEQ